ncbi:hypothetical protein [Streptomyces capitiformicae]|uniref:Uncharacterized protein n=1 Tax=Streptomyces capitiformicae TaxID=2014920 RepID=A0A919DRJ8_9ACTN|nr:hypothetical protein [Streptomyces capitiformicae]GHE68997.1 hypothetical protein GCM10017771_92750 [Streptomyces capitiformicae]
MGHGLTGNLGESAQDARDMAELSGSRQSVATVTAWQCYLAALRGDLDLALRLSEEVMEVTGGRREFLAGMVFGPLAFVALHTGDPPTCTEMLTGALHRPEPVGVASIDRMVWYNLLAEAAALLGRPNEAASWADRAQSEIRPWSPPRRTDLAHTARAHALFSTSPACALDHAKAATALFTSVGDPVAAGQAHLLAGRALNTLARPHEARTTFSRARTLFDGCGARFFALKALDEEHPAG